MREEKNQLATALEGAQARVQELESLRTEEANRYKNEKNAYKREVKKMKKANQYLAETYEANVTDMNAELIRVQEEKSQLERSFYGANARIEEVEFMSMQKNNKIRELEQRLDTIGWCFNGFRDALVTYCPYGPRSGPQQRRRSPGPRPHASRTKSRSRSRSRSPRDYRSRSRSRSPRERAHSEVSRASSSRERPQSRSRSRSRPRSGRADTATALDSGTTP